MLCTVTPFSERSMSVAIRLISDRSIIYASHSTWWLYVGRMHQARPIPSERTCVYVDMSYNTERDSYVEMRRLYKHKRPTTLTDSVILYSDKDTTAHVFMHSERNVELQSTGIIKRQSIDKIASSRLLFSVQSGYFTISAVDNRGAGIVDKNVSEKIKTRMSKTHFTLQITIT